MFISIYLFYYYNTTDQFTNLSSIMLCNGEITHKQWKRGEGGLLGVRAPEFEVRGTHTDQFDICVCSLFFPINPTIEW